MAQVDQEVRADPEVRVVLVGPGDPVDQEDQEVTYQKILYLLNILNILKIHLIFDDLSYDISISLYDFLVFFTTKNNPSV